MHWTESALVDLWSKVEESTVFIFEAGSEESWVNLDSGIRRGQFRFMPRQWGFSLPLVGTLSLMAFQPYEQAVIGSVEFGLEFRLTLPEGAIPPRLWLEQVIHAGSFGVESSYFVRHERERMVTEVCIRSAWSTPAKDLEDLESLSTHWLANAEVLQGAMADLAVSFR